MSLLKKIKELKGAKDGEDKSLNKYLPSTLFLGVQKDINEKALKGYILSISKTAFDNIGNVKYSIKKINKDEFLYEIHDGSIDLSYLPLVYNALWLDGTKEDIVLKTERNNICVRKLRNDKIETNVLLEHNSRENEATVDKSSKGRMSLIVKEGLGAFYTSAFLVAITGLISAVSFFTKYTMLNEDYSFSYEKDNSKSPIEFIESLKFTDHSEYKYVKSIKYSNGKWKEEYGIVERDENAPKSRDVKNIEEMENIEPVISKDIIEMKEIVEEQNIATEEISEMVEVEVVEKELANKVLETKEAEQPMITEDVSGLEDDVEIINIEDMPEINIVSDKKDVKKSRFEIIDMKDLNSLDLSNLPSNIVIEEGK